MIRTRKESRLNQLETHLKAQKSVLAALRRTNSIDNWIFYAMMGQVLRASLVLLKTRWITL